MSLPPSRSGLRHKFVAVLRDETVSVTLAGRQDRFARLGVEFVGAALAARAVGVVTWGAPWK